MTPALSNADRAALALRVGSTANDIATEQPAPPEVSKLRELLTPEPVVANRRL